MKDKIEAFLFIAILPYSIFLSFGLVMSILRINHTTIESGIKGIIGCLIFCFSDFCIAIMLFVYKE
jgi:hypothetical protein